MAEDTPPPAGSGLELLLMAASTDPALAERLLEDPVAAAAQCDLTLTSTEQALLSSMELERLRSMVETMTARVITPPREPAVDMVSLGIRDDSPPMGTPVCTGIRVDFPNGDPPDLPPGDSPGHGANDYTVSAGIRPTRGRGLKVAAAAAATVTALGVGGAILLSAGSRPHRPAATAPRSTPDAGAPDAAPDGGEHKTHPPKAPAPDKPTPK